MLTVIFLSLISFGAKVAWMSEAHIIRKNQRLHGVTVYRQKQLCELEQGDTCYNMVDKHWHYYNIVNGRPTMDLALKATYDAEQFAIQSAKDARKIRRDNIDTATLSELRAIVKDMNRR